MDVRPTAKARKREYVEGEEVGIIKRAMGWKRKAVTNYCRLRGGKGIGKWWENKIGRTQSAVCPRCREEESPEHVVFRCMGIRRLKDAWGRREWVEENDMRWDGWEALASKRWVRMEDTGRVDDEGKAVWI